MIKTRKAINLVLMPILFLNFFANDIPYHPAPAIGANSLHADAFREPYFLYHSLLILYQMNWILCWFLKMVFWYMFHTKTITEPFLLWFVEVVGLLFGGKEKTIMVLRREIHYLWGAYCPYSQKICYENKRLYLQHITKSELKKTHSNLVFSLFSLWKFEWKQHVKVWTWEIRMEFINTKKYEKHLLKKRMYVQIDTQKGYVC